MRICPTCGTSVPSRKAKCPGCGTMLRSPPRSKCPSCGELIPRNSKKCPICNADIPERPAKTKAVKETADQHATDLVEPEPPQTKAQDNISACPKCGAVLAGPDSKCPKCDQEPVDQPAEVAPPVAFPDSIPEIKPQEVAARPEGEAMKPTKKRTLKVAKIAAVPAAALKSAGGRTNGVGHVNGLRQTNAKEAVGGEAFVNGSGISNGLGARSRVDSAKRTSFLTRWQFLAVLVALIVVISTFVFLSYSNNSEKFSIDGNFNDWSKATTYGSVIQSTESGTNITEWAIGTQSPDLFVYIRTQTTMMSTPNAESYYLFVDSDGSNATGYVMESIGADYMLQLTGWDSAVKSTSLSRYTSNSDRYNWTAWTSIGSLSYSLDNTRLEAEAAMPAALMQTARFVLVSRDSADRGSVSCTAPLKGGVLVVEQVPSADVTANGVIPKSASVAMLTLKFKCEGQGGSVDAVNPTVTGAPMAGQLPAFSLNKNEEHEIAVTIDTSAAPDGRFVAAEMLVSGIVSSFANVEIVGSGASAYVGSPPSGIVIDGAFADWAGKTSVDQDLMPATSPSTDINQVGNVNTTHDSYFYVSAMGEMCSGTFVPSKVSKPAGTGGGGIVIPTRRTAEDVLRIYVDSDRSDSTGKQVSYNTKVIGADQLIEVRGLFGRITSMKEFNYSSSGSWVRTTDVVNAAKDEKRIEIGVSAASIGGSSDIDFIVETTTWNGQSDLATFNPASISASPLTWIVDPSTASPYATSMSYQRKTFYDGTNYWSFFFDGANTVHKYSMDNGQNWTLSGHVFATAGVNETSIWYDSLNSTVYAIGDTSTASNRVYVQVGKVDAAAHTILWAAGDAGPKTSSVALAGKNTYISKDSKGYLWVLSSNCTVLGSYQLSAFRSSAVDNASSWVFTGQMLGAASALDNVKGSIVPAGSGSNVWAVYAYAGNVAGRKYTGIWSVQALIYNSGALKVNTDNSPPSVVVDGKGVVHVVYGTGYRWGQNSIPRLQYSHNNTGLTTFTAGLELPDPLEPYTIGDYYPTISLDASMGNLFVFWIRGNSTFVPITVMGSMCVSGTWSYITFDPQTNFTKQYLTSVYSVPSGALICWQWTQNTTAPSDVLFDRTQIPEFSTLPLVTFALMATIVLAVAPRRKRQMLP